MITAKLHHRVKWNNALLVNFEASAVSICFREKWLRVEMEPQSIVQ